MRGRSAAEIKRLFNEVSPTYDLLNRLLSLGQDARWRQAAARELRPKSGDLLLDLCGGTGELAMELAERYPACRVLCIDFAEEMLRLARRKAVQPPSHTSGNGAVPFSACADGLALPLPDQSCAGIAVGFGIRNLEDTRAGLREAYRVLKQGGRLAILELMRPQGVLAPVRRFALRYLVPAASVVAAPGRAEAYRYLADSVLEYFSVGEMVAHLGEVGFAEITARRQSMGFAWVMGATRP
jgi:demethylmenaquinone methyltransferase/2-methoxy-6-polyprenyl-1,4-benzoquinol methylase